MKNTLALVAMLLLAGCTGGLQGASTTSDDALATPAPLATLAGSLDVETFDYSFGMEFFEDGRGDTLPMDLRGVIRVPEGDGVFPVLVFVHGYHGTCEYPLLPSLPTYYGNASPSVHAICPNAPPVIQPTDSFRGYDYFSEPLASQGYVIASIDAAQLNDNRMGYDWTLRAKLVLRTLDHLRDGNDGIGPHADALEGKLDMTRVGIMGHSRGGQGVTSAFVLNKERPADEQHSILAVFGIAPVDAESESSLVDDAAYGTILPYCDGDVWPLHGALTYDRARNVDANWPKIQFLVNGSNHNFYNTVWGNNADDASWMTDEHCGQDAPKGAFLSFDDVLRHGGHIQSAFFRAYVGGEEEFLSFLRGEVGLPLEACPRVDVDCASVLRVSYHPPTVDQQPLTLTGAETCEGQECSDAFNVHAEPMLLLSSSEPATWTSEVPADRADVSAFRWLSIRLALDADIEDAPRVTLELIDARGKSYAQELNGLYAAPGGLCEPVEFPLGFLGDDGSCNARLVLSEYRVPLAAVSGVDLGDITSVTLHVEGAAELVATDLMFGR